MTTSKLVPPYLDPRDYGLPRAEDLALQDPSEAGALTRPEEIKAPSDYHIGEAQVPQEFYPTNLGSLQSIPDYYGPLALVPPEEFAPTGLGSIESIPDYHVPQAIVPSELNIENLGSAESIPDLAGTKNTVPSLDSLGTVPELGPVTETEGQIIGLPIPMRGGQHQEALRLFNQGAAILAALNLVGDPHGHVSQEPYSHLGVDPVSQSLAYASLNSQQPVRPELISQQTLPPAKAPEEVKSNDGHKPKLSIGSSSLAGSLRPLPYIGTRTVDEVRADFPILSEIVDGGQRLVWFDNAATTQKPKAVIDRLARYYEQENSNVHRGAHALATRATEAYEEAREKAARFMGAKSSSNIVFVRGTTEGINLIAQSYVKPRLRPGDEIILSVLEHHANIVPWQVLATETGALLKVAPVDSTGQINYAEYLKLFSPRTRFVSVAHVSNALGTVTPVSALIAAAHGHGVPIAIDGAQSISHLPINVTGLGADFFVFSGHKIYGPTGIGVLYGTDEALVDAKPYQTGGNMIVDVTFEKTVYQGPPQKFEAGTGNIADAVGLGAALDYVSELGLVNIASYEESLLRYATDLVSQIPKVTIIGTAACKASVLSFVVEGVDTLEVGSRLSSAGIAVRAGHHCAQPIVRKFGLEGTVRASLAFYNTAEEVEYFASILRQIAR
ncbi:MAG: cysteine desulfurase [Deltaproteobacteria bacterium]|jgi:cysteine desulfurase/selenocysteine lyase|nr:cysteine desulfurase [Deltaproteobacteria bacterium]